MIDIYGPTKPPYVCFPFEHCPDRKNYDYLWYRRAKVLYMERNLVVFFNQGLDNMATAHINCCKKSTLYDKLPELKKNSVS